MFGRLALALQAALEGHTQQARTAVFAVSLHREASGDLDGEMTFKRAQILSLAGDTDRALKELEHAVAQGFVCPTCIETSALLGPLRLQPEYAAIAQRARARHLEFGKRFALLNGK